MKSLKIMGIGLLSFLMIGVATVNAAVVEVKNEEELTSCVATSENTCKLTDNIVLSKQLNIKSDVVIDLNGKSITPNETLKLSQGLVMVYRNAKLTVNDTVGTGKISSGNSGNVWGGIEVVNLYDKDETKTAELIINGGTIEGYYWGVVGNGTLHNTKITINAGTIKGINEDSLGIYHPQDGILTINGGTIEGGTGIEIRSGSLIMNDGTVKGLLIPTSVMPNGNGSTTEGAGIAVAQHTTKKAINVTINGGTVEGYTALYESNPQKNPEDIIAKVSLKVAGGEFKAINGGKNAIYSEDFTKFITGGIFSSEVTEYIATDLSSEKVENGYKVGKIYTITVKEIANGSVTADIKEGMLDDVVKLTVKASEGYELKELVVKDASGKEVTVTNNSFKLPASNVTISATFSKIEIKTEVPKIDTTETPKETVVGVSDSEKISNVLLDTLAESKDLKDAIAGISVTTSLDIKTITSTDTEVKNVEKALENNKIKDAKVSDFFDITINVKNANTNAVIGTLPELKDKIELVVALPEDLLSVAEGYTRTYYIVRNHNGVLDVLDTVLSKDSKSISFTSDKFSTYAIAYVDTPISNPSIPESPKTGDNIIVYVTLGLLSVCGIGYMVKTKKFN